MSTSQQGRATHKTYTRAYEPEPTMAGHLTFALKYEGVAPLLQEALAPLAPALTLTGDRHAPGPA